MLGDFKFCARSFVWKFLFECGSKFWLHEFALVTTAEEGPCAGRMCSRDEHRQCEQLSVPPGNSRFPAAQGLTVPGLRAFWQRMHTHWYSLAQGQLGGQTGLADTLKCPRESPSMLPSRPSCLSSAQMRNFLRSHLPQVLLPFCSFGLISPSNQTKPICFPSFVTSWCDMPVDIVGFQVWVCSSFPIFRHLMGGQGPICEALVSVPVIWDISFLAMKYKTVCTVPLGLHSVPYLGWESRFQEKELPRSGFITRGVENTASILGYQILEENLSVKFTARPSYGRVRC